MWLNDAMENSLMGLNIQVGSLMTRSQWALKMNPSYPSTHDAIARIREDWSLWQLLTLTS